MNTLTQSQVKTQLTALVVSALAMMAVTSCAPQNNKSLSANAFIEMKHQSAIIGGEASKSEFQKQNGIVQLIIFTSQGEATCTGTLIARDIILTAAHCVEGDELLGVDVLFGLDDVNTSEENIIGAKSGAIHPDYFPTDDVTEIWNDIALLKLEKDAPADFQVSRIPLTSNEIHLDQKSKLTLSGFGITSAIINKIGKNSKGKDIIIELPQEGGGSLREVHQIPVVGVSSDLKEITLDQRSLRGACHGDSGGPALFLQDDGTYIQVGVTSRGTENLGNCNKGVVYTGVAGYLDWIQATIEKLNTEDVNIPEPIKPLELPVVAESALN